MSDTSLIIAMLYYSKGDLPMVTNQFLHDGLLGTFFLDIMFYVYLYYVLDLFMHIFLFGLLGTFCTTSDGEAPRAAAS